MPYGVGLTFLEIAYVCRQKSALRRCNYSFSNSLIKEHIHHIYCPLCWELYKSIWNRAGSMLLLCPHLLIVTVHKQQPKREKKSFIPESDKWYDFLFSVLLGSDQKSICALWLLCIIYLEVKFILWINSIILLLSQRRKMISPWW